EPPRSLGSGQPLVEASPEHSKRSMLSRDWKRPAYLTWEKEDRQSRPPHTGQPDGPRPDRGSQRVACAGLPHRNGWQNYACGTFAAPWASGGLQSRGTILLSRRSEGAAHNETPS